jgi:glutamate synthase (NADPH/NADH)
MLSRGINEGRQAAREVDTYLMGTVSQLPVTGGIVRRPAVDSLPPVPKIQVQAVTA